MMPGLFVIGTDTGVGKTTIAATIISVMAAEGRGVAALKPVATGAIMTAEGWHSEDVEKLREAIGIPVPTECLCPLIYEEPLAPCVAARRAGRPLLEPDFNRAIQKALEWWAERSEVMVIEGIGGFMCPLTETSTLADMAIKLDYPLVVVARNALGTLNHTLLTIEAARSRGLRIAGIVLNSAQAGSGNEGESSNHWELAARLPGVAILADVPHGGPETLRKYVQSVDWYKIAGRARYLPVAPATA